MRCAKVITSAVRRNARPVEQEQLRRRLRGDEIGTLEQARRYLKEAFAVDYTVGGVSCLFQRMKIKLKTGRPTNLKQDKEQREEFAKKNIRF